MRLLDRPPEWAANGGLADVIRNVPEQLELAKS